MKKYSLFFFFSFLCGAIIFITADELFSQRGMKITIRTKTGKQIPLYKDSYALVVGNGTYTNGWDPLPGALRDVTEVAETLKTHGFRVNLKKDLTKSEFEHAFAEFVHTAGQDPNNRLLFYYAGHGSTEKTASGTDLGSLVMVDAPLLKKDRALFALRSVDMKSVVTGAERIHSRHVLFVFDSCFSGTILNVRAQVETPESISDSIKYPVRQFITAGRAGETVPDKSVFKQAFLDLIEGRAKEPISDGYITGEELGIYLKNQVPRYNSMQHPQYGKIQDPNLDKGDFVFVLGNADNSEDGEPLSTLAILHVTSTPSGAAVYLDGKRIGSTPLRQVQIDTGVRRKKQIEVGLELSGYRSHIERLTLLGGRITSWDLNLEKLSAPKSSPKPASPESLIPGSMVLIPAGEFDMGSNKGDEDEKPVHTVYVDAFYMDKYEVTNAEYQRFVDANPQWQKDRIPSRLHNGDYLKHWRGNSYPVRKGNHPVIYVNWYAAVAYSKWAGKRLPTEAEWEKAAHGGLMELEYPWGNTISVGRANYGGNDTKPVGSYSANGYGLYDLAGNVWEWCLDEYDRKFYKHSPSQNPLSGANSINWLLGKYTEIKSSRVQRGAGWDSTIRFVRIANRVGTMPTNASSNLGFRCVRSVTP